MNIALAGNPNCGKTTLFNALTGGNQTVGNFPGVTVERKTGHYKKDKTISIIDLPGVYSLTPFSAEETVTGDCLREFKDRPGSCVVNIVDGTTLERGLYLTLQVLATGVPAIVAINLSDVMRGRGIKLDTDALSRELGVPVTEISALRSEGLDELTELCKSARTGYAAPDVSAEALYKNVDAILEKCLNVPARNLPKFSLSEKLDKIATGRWTALPLFALIMFLVYYISVTTVGTLVTDWANDGVFGYEAGESVGWHLFGIEPLYIPSVPTLLEPVLANAPEWLHSLVMDGIIAGVGAVLGFVPQMAVLFAFLAIMEASGYMARVAFIMDRIFARFGLSGKSFIPLIIGSGCGVPGIMASRTIENEKDRRITIMTTTFIPCGAKLPVIALISGAFFRGAWWVAPTSYLIGVAAVILSGAMLKKSRLFAGEDLPFVMELPDYRLPPVSYILHNIAARVGGFIRKAGTIILGSCVLIWWLSYAGLLEGIGQVFAPLFAPVGFGDWQASVAVITGLIAKENIVGTMEVMYGSDGLVSAFTTLSAFSFLVFNLLCAPCFAAIGAIAREMNSLKWTCAAILHQTLFAYAASLIIYTFGMWLSAGQFNVFTIIAMLVLVRTVVIVFFKERKIVPASVEMLTQNFSPVTQDTVWCKMCGGCAGCAHTRTIEPQTEKT